MKIKASRKEIEYDLYFGLTETELVKLSVGFREVLHVLPNTEFNFILNEIVAALERVKINGYIVEGEIEFNNE